MTCTEVMLQWFIIASEFRDKDYYYYYYYLPSTPKQQNREQKGTHTEHKNKTIKAIKIITSPTYNDD